jgi:hypothetical protein
MVLVFGKIRTYFEQSEKQGSAKQVLISKKIVNVLARPPAAASLLQRGVPTHRAGVYPAEWRDYFLRARFLASFAGFYIFILYFSSW